MNGTRTALAAGVPWPSAETIAEVHGDMQRRRCTCPTSDLSGQVTAQEPTCPSHADVTVLLAAIRDLDAAAKRRLAAPGKSHRVRTSRDAATLSFRSQRYRVLRRVADAGRIGTTAAEVAGFCGISRNQAGARLLELREADWVEYVVVDGARMTQPTTWGGDGSVLARGYAQRITDAGLTVLVEAAQEATS